MSQLIEALKRAWRKQPGSSLNSALSFRSKAYIAAVICCGFAVLAINAGSFRTPDPYRFGWYLLLALVASGMKVRLPGVTGTLSVLFLFVFINVIQLSLPETLAIGLAATFVQSFWRAKKPRLIHLGFNIASLAIATSATYLVYQAGESLKIDAFGPLRLAAAVLVFFAANTLIVSVIIAFTENRRVLQTWKSGSLWSLPYYAVGGCVAGLFDYATRAVGWQVSILILPIIYITYRSYELYLKNLRESRRHAEEMQAAANQVKSVLESTTDCVLAIDGEGRVTYTNQRSRARMFGDSDPVGTVLWARFPMLAAGGFQDHLRAALLERTPLGAEEYFPELNAWFEVHAYPSASGIALYLKEVTEQRELVERLRQAQKMEAVGRLAGGVAHDFNNLLTIILGYGQIVADTLGPDHPVQSVIAEVLQAGERAAAVTGRLLAFSRKQVLNPEVLDLNVVISGMERMLRRLIGEDVGMTVSLDPSAAKIRADQNQIEQVVMNLAVNARDAMPTGGEFRISTHSEPAGGDGQRDPAGRYTVLRVSDTGCGMDAETRSRIFEPFFTTREKGKGTGLGLSVVYGIVQQSEGYITVESEVGRGTAFQICLPCVEDTEEKPAEIPDSNSWSAGAGKILLIEDEQAVKELTLRMLTQAGYTVVSPETGGDALVLSKTELDAIDVLITDVVMPGMSGADLSAHLMKRNPSLKVLYLSGHIDHALISAHPWPEGATLLQKPFSQAQLLRRVQKVLDSRARAA